MPILINLDSEDEDIEEARFQEELKHVLEVSKAESCSSVGNSQMAPGQSVVSSFLSERAQLEKERRERQKRLRPQTSYDPTAAPDDDDLEVPPAKRQQVSCSPTIEQVFWNGELRQTATQNAEPRKDDQATIRLTDVLGKVKFFLLVLDPYFSS